MSWRRGTQFRALTLHAKGGGGGGGSTTTVQKADPWEGQQEYLRDIFGEAQRQYEAGAPQYYPESTVLPLNSQQLAAQQGTLGATGTVQNLANQGAQATGFALNSPNVYQNPAVQAAAQGIVNPIVDTLQRQVLPGVRSGAIQAGAYGGSRQGIAEGLAVQGASREMADQLAQFYSDQYTAGLDAQAKALALLPQTQQTQIAAPQLVGAVGDQNYALDQAYLQEAINRYNYNSTSDRMALAEYMNIVNGSYGGVGTSTATNSNGGGGFGGILGGGLSGWSLGSSLLGPSGLGLFSSSAAGPIGALVGVLGSFL